MHALQKRAVQVLGTNTPYTAKVDLSSTAKARSPRAAGSGPHPEGPLGAGADEKQYINLVANSYETSCTPETIGPV